jgi:hypothetical protein
VRLPLWKPEGRLPWLIAAVILIVGAGYALGAGQPKAPPLTSAYGSLAAHWDQVAAAVGADPGQTYLNSWNLTYGADGEVRELYLTFVVDDGSGYTWYSYNQRGTGRPRLEATNSVTSRPLGPVPAHIFFEELDAAGLKSLEAHSGQEPPVRLWSHATYSDSSHYGQQVGAHVIANGQIARVRPEGIRLSGGHMTLLVSRNETGSRDSLLYVVPRAVSP